ncbi:MAG TPA: GMC oxidoreductase [Bacteroidota bacterium]|nr:GMC oxidoreductase [Bacteroidota bacterium]
METASRRRFLKQTFFRAVVLSSSKFHPHLCRTGADPGRSVVDSHSQSHDVKSLFVIDESTIPSSLGVDPQVIILAIEEKKP